MGTVIDFTNVFNRPIRNMVGKDQPMTGAKLTGRIYRYAEKHGLIINTEERVKKRKTVKGEQIEKKRRSKRVAAPIKREKVVVKKERKQEKALLRYQLGTRVKVESLKYPDTVVKGKVIQVKPHKVKIEFKNDRETWSGWWTPEHLEQWPLKVLKTV